MSIKIMRSDTLQIKQELKEMGEDLEDFIKLNSEAHYPSESASNGDILEICKYMEKVIKSLTSINDRIGTLEMRIRTGGPL